MQCHVQLHKVPAYTILLSGSPELQGRQAGRPHPGTPLILSPEGLSQSCLPGHLLAPLNKQPHSPPQRCPETWPGVDTVWGACWGWCGMWGGPLVTGGFGLLSSAAWGPGRLGVEDHLGDLAVLHGRAIVVPSRVAKGEACLGPRRWRLVGHLAQAFGAVVGVRALWGWGHSAIRTPPPQDWGTNWAEGSRAPQRGVCAVGPQGGRPSNLHQMAPL